MQRVFAVRFSGDGTYVFSGGGWDGGLGGGQHGCGAAAEAQGKLADDPNTQQGKGLSGPPNTMICLSHTWQ